MWRQDTRRTILGLLLVLLALTLQGCVVDPRRHTIGNWQTTDSYFTTFQFLWPGNTSTPLVNSCNSPEVPDVLKCSGRGVCASWYDVPQTLSGMHAALQSNSTNSTKGAKYSTIRFCKCDPLWADPECRTERKSQLTSYLLSLFGGLIGLDQFYLGYYALAILKLITLGGAGIWWVFDIVRIGSCPVVSASGFKVSQDIQHWAFVLSATVFFFMLSVILSVWSIHVHRIKKAKEVLLLKAEVADFGSLGSANYGQSPVAFQSGYASALPTAAHYSRSQLPQSRQLI